MVKEKDGEKSPGKLANPTYAAWLLEAIRKIKHQKQRPNVERIAHAVQQHHNVSYESIEEQLELAVKDGSVLKILNNGVSYKDPSGVTALKSRYLKIGKKSDLTKIVLRSIKELGQEDGSTAKTIEKFVRRSYNIDAESDSDVTHSVRISIKRAVNSMHIIQDGRNYKVYNGHAHRNGLDSPRCTDDDYEPLVDITALEKNKVISSQ